MDQLAVLQMAVALLRMNIGRTASLYSNEWQAMGNRKTDQISLWMHLQRMDGSSPNNIMNIIIA
jgi:hypothetical protein